MITIRIDAIMIINERQEELQIDRESDGKISICLPNDGSFSVHHNDFGKVIEAIQQFDE